MAVNGKLLAGHNFIYDDQDTDQLSVCSCNCLGGGNNSENHQLLLDQSNYYQPALTNEEENEKAEIMDANDQHSGLVFSFKRASV